jgi:hypothetical protein
MAIAFPRPRAAPVTTAVLPWRLKRSVMVMHEREVRNCEGRMILSGCVHEESLWQTRLNNK